MTQSDEIENLRAAVRSLQSGLVAALESLEILTTRSGSREEIEQQIRAIKQSVQQLQVNPMAAGAAGANSPEEE